VDEKFRDEIKRHLSAARQSQANHAADILRLENLHEAELLTLADLADVQADKLADALADIERLKTALEARDVIGQAKGLTMAALGCSSDEAFVMLVQQSQHDNREVRAVAEQIVSSATRRLRTQ
jgi:AmiR/NasT family two-component response regulator